MFTDEATLKPCQNTLSTLVLIPKSNYSPGQIMKIQVLSFHSDGTPYRGEVDIGMQVGVRWNGWNKSIGCNKFLIWCTAGSILSFCAWLPHCSAGEDRMGNVIQWWHSLDSLQGMATAEMRVPHHPVPQYPHFGMWKIQAIVLVRLNPLFTTTLP